LEGEGEWLLEFLHGEGASLLKFLDDEAGSGELNLDALGGLGDGNVLGEHVLDQLFALLNGGGNTLRDILA
jgi:hypothetical protein